IDCEDRDCMNTPACGIISPEICDNGMDDDRDGLIDCEDDECLNDPACMLVGECDAVYLTGCSLPLQRCYFQRSDYLGHCLWAFGNAGIGEACNTETDCQQGLFCNGYNKVCLQLCHTAMTGECPPNQTCRTVPAWGASPYGGCQ
ncbi:MAG: hypothetical protein CVU59_13845, partial [Deltaproteobacteria bacterium HGW-Deltaproteobacteria-17]